MQFVARASELFQYTNLFSKLLIKQGLEPDWKFFKLIYSDGLMIFKFIPDNESELVITHSLSPSNNDDRVFECILPVSETNSVLKALKKEFVTILLSDDGSGCKIVSETKTHLIPTFSGYALVSDLSSFSKEVVFDGTTGLITDLEETIRFASKESLKPNLQRAVISDTPEGLLLTGCDGFCFKRIKLKDSDYKYQVPQKEGTLGMSVGEFNQYKQSIHDQVNSNTVKGMALWELKEIEREFEKLTGQDQLISFSPRVVKILGLLHGLFAGPSAMAISACQEAGEEMRPYGEASIKTPWQMIKLYFRDTNEPMLPYRELISAIPLPIASLTINAEEFREALEEFKPFVKERGYDAIAFLVGDQPRLEFTDLEASKEHSINLKNTTFTGMKLYTGFSVKNISTLINKYAGAVTLEFTGYNKPLVIRESEDSFSFMSTIQIYNAWQGEEPVT